MAWKLLVVLMIAEVYGNPVENVSATPTINNATQVLNKSSHNSRNVIIDGLTCTCNIGASVTSRRDDYKHVPGVGSYKLHTRALDWNTARKTCNEEGAHLIVINSAVEALVLRDMATIAGTAYAVFVGFHDFYKEGEWTTIFGETLERAGYDKWKDNEPNNAAGKENCAIWHVTGLNDVRCDSTNWYVCELPIIRHLH